MRQRSLLSKLTLPLLMVSLVSCSNESTTQPEPTLAEELQAALDNGIETYGGKGISVAVMIPGEETWVGVSGVSYGTTPITTDMLFSAGSITKTFTAMTVIQLAEEGVLTLEDSLYEWVPDYLNIDNTITIRQLLNHTCGIYNFTENSELWAAIFADLTRSWMMEEVLSNYVLDPYFPKGTGWHYSNTGYLLLRLIIREAAGTDISTQYRERFFEPLGLDRSFLAVEEALPGNVAHGWFDLDGDNIYDDFSNIPANAFYTAIGGGVFSTPEDLAKWAKALFHDRLVLSQQYFDQMIDFHTPTPGEPLVYGYGLGAIWFSPELFNNLEVWGHGGNPLGYAAGCLYLVDYGVCIGIMDNTEEGETMPVINDILSVITNHLDQTS